MVSPVEDSISLAQAASVLGVGPEQVRRYIKSGQLHSLRAPDSRAHHRVLLSEVESLRQSRGVRDPSVHELLKRVSQLEHRLEVGDSPQRPDEATALRAENLRLKDSESRLAMAAEAEREANRALRKALRAQVKANRLQAAAEEASARAAEEYAAVLRTYRMPDYVSEAPHVHHE